jgi:RNA polymerase sigma-70 factor (ECF subfamily)
MLLIFDKKQRWKKFLYTNREPLFGSEKRTLEILFMTLSQNHEDSELVGLLIQGDRKAFETIYLRYASDLYRFARKNIPLKEDCEEMVQDVFESLWIRRENLKVESLRHYLFTSIRYMIIRYFYAKGVRKRYAEDYKLFAASYHTIDDLMNSPNESPQEKLIKSLAGLPQRCQTAIKLRLTENLSNDEIAHQMNITKKTVEFYISRALNHLRHSVKEIYK